jgi:hypothetical protein
MSSGLDFFSTNVSTAQLKVYSSCPIERAVLWFKSFVIPTFVEERYRLTHLLSAFVSETTPIICRRGGVARLGYIVR